MMLRKYLENKLVANILSRMSFMAKSYMNALVNYMSVIDPILHNRRTSK